MNCSIRFSPVAILFAISAVANLSFGQQLKPSIGLSALPADADSICPIPVYTGSFYTSGIAEGDTIADFTFYTAAGIGVNMQQELIDKKPILLVAGSYTCPVFRNKMSELNSIVSTYGSSLKVFIIYVVEAHPIVDPSPYSGTVWVTSQNQSQGVLYRQPQTYGERKSIIQDMTTNMNILPTILVDGPCNEWWSYFGPAPNNAYLIDTNGIVFSKHGWFSKPPDNMKCDIDSLFGNPCGGGGTANGTFTFSLVSNDSGQPADIEIIRTQNNLPSGWESALCVDICLGSWIDTTYLYLMPGDTQLFTLYFYTDSNPNTGQVRMRFANTNVPSNYYVQNYYASTLSSAIIIVCPGFSDLTVYPNPTSDVLNLVDPHGAELSEVEITDMNGRLVFRQSGIGAGSFSVDVSHLASGVYSLRVSGLTTYPPVRFVKN
jgi:hypothetical protein